jgi:hypothetical protein
MRLGLCAACLVTNDTTGRSLTWAGAHDAHVFEAHQGVEDLTRVDKDEGASCFLAHTSSLKRLRLILGANSTDGRNELRELL